MAIAPVDQSQAKPTTGAELVARARALTPMLAAACCRGRTSA